MNLTLIAEMVTDGFPERKLLGRRADAITAAEFLRRAQAGARHLREAGASALVYLAVNGPALPVALLAAAGAGVPLVPLNYRSSTERMRSLLANHPGALVIADESFESVVAEAGYPSVTRDEWLSITSAEGASWPSDAEETESGAAIIYTSGTTSEPKGVLLMHDNLLSYTFGTVEFGSATEEEATLVSVPPYHIAAVANIVTNLYACRRSITLEQFSAESWLELARQEEITHAVVVPTMLARILQAPGDLSVPSLRNLAYGGAPMPESIVRRALEVWPSVDFVNAYGLTETASTITVLTPQDHRDALESSEERVRTRLASVGKPLPHITIDIRNEEGHIVPAGVPGRIWVHGQQVSGKYAGRKSGLDEHGFFDTRDEGYLDEDGYLFLRGRTDDTIIRGGENIAPAEIEEALMQADHVADAVVVGLPDPDWGQIIAAVVVPDPGTDVDVDHVKETVRGRLRSSKTPDHVLVWESIPRNEMSKVVRRDIQAHVEAELAAK
jgi:acyl-CoA synthetase (AMP-forming)/AMP-acid ligase II